MHLLLLSNGHSSAFDDCWTHSRLLYINIREVQVPDTNLRRVILFDDKFQIQIDSTDIHCLERYPEGENKITVRLNEKWGEKNVASMNALFPSAALGMFFDATFTFYTTRTMNFISSITGGDFCMSIETQKATVLISATQQRFEPQVEELMLIHGPMPPGAVSFPAQDIFNMRDRGLVAASVPNYGYGLVMKISKNSVQVQYRNMRRWLSKHYILEDFITFVTDLSYAELDPEFVARFDEISL